MSDSTKAWLAFFGAISGAIAAIIVALIQTNKNDVLDKKVSDCDQQYTILLNRYDSLRKVINRPNSVLSESKQNETTLPQQTNSSSPTSDKVVHTETEQKKDVQQGGSHLVELGSATGNKNNQTVTVKFMVTNEKYDNYEQIWITQSIGKFQGQTFYPARATLGDKTGIGQNGVGWTSPQMQTIKGEPTAASLFFVDVPPTVEKFSTMTLNANGDVITFKNVIIRWQ